jgi:hypothetical protein
MSDFPLHYIRESDNFIVRIVFIERPGKVGSVTCKYEDPIVALDTAGDSFGVPTRCLLFQFGDKPRYNNAVTRPAECVSSHISR